MMCTYNADRVERLLEGDERKPLARIALLTGEQGELSIKRYGVQIVFRDECSNQCFVHFCKNHVFLCANKTAQDQVSHFDKCTLLFYSGFKNVGGDIRIVYSLRGHYYT